MGIYLQNVYMPKNDVLTIEIFPDGSIWQQYRGTVPNAKAVNVPPHGRLIDEKAVIDHFVSLSNNEWNQNVCTSWANAFAEAASDICDIPTIIEAEEET